VVKKQTPQKFLVIVSVILYQAQITVFGYQRLKGTIV